MSDPSRNGPWTVKSTETAFRNPWIRVESSEVVHPDGKDGIYGVVRYANYATGVLPLDEQGFTWLVGQHRFPFDAYSWELPEGGGPKDASPQDSAARELKEEAGLVAANWIEIGHCYLAWGLSAGQTAPESSEELALKRVKFSDLLAMCLSGEVTDAFTCLMVFAARAKAEAGEYPDEIAQLLLDAG